MDKPASSEPAPPGRRPKPRKPQLTERDLALLSFAAEHRIVLSSHAQALLGVSAAAAYARLHALTAEGILAQRTVFHRQPGCYRITRRGLTAIGSRYPQPQIDLSCYQHDVGVAWLWLAASRGVWGPMREIISERQMRSADATPDRVAEPPWGVRLGGLGPGGRERRHYPDLLLITPDGRRIALELELSAKGRARRETILSGYSFDRRIDAVIYLVDQPAVARAVRSSAARLGISELIHVQPVRWSGSSSQAAPARALQRAPRPQSRAAAR